MIKGIYLVVVVGVDFTANVESVGVHFYKHGHIEDTKAFLVYHSHYLWAMTVS